MAELIHDKKVTLDIDEPLVNVGRYPGGIYNGNNNTTTFKGRVEVDAATAEDLLARQKEWRNHQNNLHRDNGQRDLDAGGFTGNQA